MPSAGGSPLLGSSSKSIALSVLSAPANPGFSIGHDSLPRYADAARLATMQQIAQIESSADHPMYRAYALAQQQDTTYNASLGPIIAAPMSDTASNPELAGPFSAVAGADSYLVISQLFQIAKIIKARGLIGGTRHIFDVDMSCFDTHNGQAGQHLDFMRALGAGLWPLGLLRRHEGAGLERQRHRVHDLRLRALLPGQRQRRHRPRLGQRAHRGWRRGRWRKVLRRTRSW